MRNTQDYSTCLTVSMKMCWTRLDRKTIFHTVPRKYGVSNIIEICRRA